MPEQTLLDAALAHARRGWHVFPLLPDDKRPAIRNWEHRATTDTDRITRCFGSGPYGIGIACGPSHLVVLDLDRPKTGTERPAAWRIPGVHCGADVLAVLAERAGQPYEALMDTYTVHTGSGGLHLYYRAPADTELRNTAGQLGWLIDTRAAGGYVVAAGTPVGGRRYTVATDAPAAPLPAWLAEHLQPPTPPTVDTTHLDALLQHLDRRGDYATAALRAEIQAVLDATEGTRNNTLVRAAFCLGQLAAGGLLPEDLVTDALLAAGRAIGLPNAECVRTIASGLRAGARRPRGGAA